MDLNKHTLAAGFDKYAKGYDDVAHLQSHVSETLANYMHMAMVRDGISVAKSMNKSLTMIDVGCGTGFCIQSVVHMLAVKGFVDEATKTKVLGLDISAGMVAECVAKFEDFKQDWVFLQGDFDEFNVEKQHAGGFNTGEFDIVASSFSAHWFQGLDRFFEKAHRLLKTGGMLVLALPVAGSLKELTAVNDALESNQRLAMLEFPCHKDVMTALLAQGFAPKLHTRQGFSTPYPSAAEALRSMKNVGSSLPVNSPLAGGTTPSSNQPRNLKPFLRKYEEMFLKGNGNGNANNNKGNDNSNANREQPQPIGGSIPLSYEVLFIIAQK